MPITHRSPVSGVDVSAGPPSCDVLVTPRVAHPTESAVDERLCSTQRSSAVITEASPDRAHPDAIGAVTLGNITLAHRQATNFVVCCEPVIIGSGVPQSIEGPQAGGASAAQGVRQTRVERIVRLQDELRESGLHVRTLLFGSGEEVRVVRRRKIKAAHRMAHDRDATTVCREPGPARVVSIDRMPAGNPARVQRGNLGGERSEEVPIEGVGDVFLYEAHILKPKQHHNAMRGAVRSVDAYAT